MPAPDLPRLFEAIEGTWPPARVWSEAGALLRDGQGGGKRVSAATGTHKLDLAGAEAAMRTIAQPPLFMIRPGEGALDDRLAQEGYARIDPVTLLVTETHRLTNEPLPRVSTFAIWEPLAIMTEIWAAGGIGPARIAVMHRAAEKTAILGRCRDRPAGVAFAAIHDGVCMVHAVEVVPDQRRQGVAQRMMRRAAFWAQDKGARWMAVLCVEDNASAIALYQGLGFQALGGYHYRIKERA